MKGWDQEWDRVFSTRDWGKYPPEELVRFTSRNFYRSSVRKDVRFLDIGCGTGASSWYLAREGFSVYGIDGSRIAIRRARDRLEKEGLIANFRIGDFTHLKYPDHLFDCAIDVCSIQHVRPKEAEAAVFGVNRTLKQSGRIFSMLVSDGTWKEPYSDKGYTHFYRLGEVKQLYRNFDNVVIEKSVRTEENMNKRVMHWVVSGVSPAVVS